VGISEIDKSAADTIIGNIYTEEDRENAKIENKRSQMDPSVSDAASLRIAQDELVNPEIVNYQHDAVTAASSEVPPVAEHAQASEENKTVPLTSINPRLKA